MSSVQLEGSLYFTLLFYTRRERFIPLLLHHALHWKTRESRLSLSIVLFFETEKEEHNKKEKTNMLIKERGEMVFMDKKTTKHKTNTAIPS